MRARTAIRRRTSGFSLLEVLVTIVIVAVGLLGVAGLQVAAVKLADVSAVRTQGIQLTSEITEKMRANYAAIRDGTLGAYVVAYGATPTGSTLAAQDVAAWKTSLAALPGGDGKIDVTKDTAGCVSVALFVDCQIVEVTVRWSDARARGGTDETVKKFSVKTRL